MGATPQLEGVIARYALPAGLRAEALATGLIHSTYALHDAQSGAPRYVAQRLHPVLASDAIAEDYAAVTEHLKRVGATAPQLLRTLQGDALADVEGERWRVSTWVPGRTREIVDAPALARAAGAGLGRFHRQLGSIEHRFRSAHPLHVTPTVLRRFQDALALPEAAGLGEAFAALAEEVSVELPALFLPPLPVRCVHGDPKISNLRFGEDGEVVGLIDLDTCARHSVLVDLGDALRSWCNAAREDETPRFDLALAVAALEGWQSEGPALSPEERSALPDAPRLITLELAARFLEDAVRDSYFGWDPARFESRRAHNLARGEAMVQLAREMSAAREALAAAISQAASP